MTGKTFRIELAGSGESFSCRAGDSLHLAMDRAGRRDLPSGCRSGGCGKCLIRIVSGSYTRRVMSREHVTAEDEQAGFALTCRVWPTSDLTVQLMFGQRRPPSQNEANIHARANPAAK